jgi:hypothetical protein
MGLSCSLKREELKSIIANIFALGICLFVADISSLMARQIDISVTGSWKETIDASDLRGEPGTDLVDAYTSAEGRVSVSVDKVVYGNLRDWFINYNWDKVNADDCSTMVIYTVVEL